MRPSTRRFAALALLCLTALLALPTAALAKGAESWAGTWRIEMRFGSVTPPPFEIEIAPTMPEVVSGKGVKLTLMSFSSEAFAFKVLDKDGSSLSALRPGGETAPAEEFDRFSGEVWQSTRGDGVFTAQRVNHLSGFYIEGPRTLEWGQQAEYRLVYASKGERRTWHGGAKWGMRRSEGVELLGRRGDAKRMLKTPKAPDDFAEARIRLRAIGEGLPEIARHLRRASVSVLVTNVPKQCEALKDKAVRAASRVDALEGRMSSLEARLAALAFPEPWRPKTLNALKQRIADEQKAIASLTQDEQRAMETLDRLRLSERRIAAYRRGAQRLATPIGRAFHALGWYKRTAGSRRDKIDFIRLYTGRKPASPDIDAEFLAAYLKAQRAGVAKVGEALVSIGGLVALARGPAASNVAGIKEALQAGFSVALGDYVDKKVNATMRSALANSAAAAEAFVGDSGRIGALAKRYQSASGDARERLAAELNRAALKAMISAIEAERRMRAAMAPTRAGLREIRSAMTKRRVTLGALEAQLKRQQIAKENQLDATYAAWGKQDALANDLKKAAAELTNARKDLAYYRELQRKHCPDDVAAAEPTSVSAEAPAETAETPPYRCRRGPMLASSFFAGGADGWTLDGDGEKLKAVGGHIQAHDQGRGHYWYFAAPPTYLAARGGLYGGVMSFELNQLEQGSSTFHDRILVLSDGALELVYTPSASQPAEGWVRFQVCLHDRAEGWSVGGGKEKLSPELFKRVLAALKSIRVNVEHSSDRDVGGLRNVLLFSGR